MECIPGKHPMIMDYINLQLGRIKSGHQLFSEIEGELLIIVNKKLIFSEKGILLLELAKSLHDWLNNFPDNFNYYSMDYEDGPILSFIKQDFKKWKISGIWINNKDPLYVDYNFLADASRIFIKKLLRQLEKHVNISNLF